MPGYKIIKLLVCAILLFSNCTQRSETNYEGSPPSTKPIVAPSVTVEDFVSDPPKTRPEFYDSIDELARLGGKGDLRSISISDDDVELRVWGGFGLTRLEGFILNRIKGKWSATQIHERFSKNEKVVNPLNAPKIGWEAAWQSLLQHQILTLPDSKTIKCENVMEDGYTYVIEVRKGAAYRTYSYSNPDPSQCEQSKAILKIADIIRDEYGGV